MHPAGLCCMLYIVRLISGLFLSRLAPTNESTGSVLQVNLSEGDNRTGLALQRVDGLV